MVSSFVIDVKTSYSCPWSVSAKLEIVTSQFVPSSPNTLLIIYLSLHFIVIRRDRRARLKEIHISRLILAILTRRTII